VFLGGEGDAFLGVADGADAVGVDLDVFGVGRGDLEPVEEEDGAAGVELVGGEGMDDFDERELNGGAVFDIRELERETGRLGIRTPVRVEGGSSRWSPALTG
jgi:hypothetical protein